METAALTFARPALLHVLWLLPLVIALFWWAESRRRTLIGRVVAPKLRTLLAGNTSPARRWFRMACVLGALGLLIVTLAGPRLGYDTLEVPHRGRDVIIAMDVSRSMLATDVAPNRLDRAKLLAEDLIEELGSDRVGLIAFAGSAFLQAPLTLDHGAVLAALDELDTSVIPKGGTNIAAAIRMAEEAFGKAEGFSRALVIISDGEELDADGVAAAKQAAAAGLRIFTVGVGSAEGSEIQLESGDLVRDPAGKVVRSRLDEGRMKQIAEATGGFYTPLDEGTARRLSVDGVDKLAETEFNANTARRPIERYQWPLAAAIGLLALQTLVGERRRRTAAAAAAMWVCLSPSVWAAPAGVTAYEQGDYEQARKVFEDRLRSEPDAPNLQMNAGAAAYRLKDYGKAAEYFSRAMLAEDPSLRSAAEFNLANTLFRMGQGQQARDKKKTDWKDAIAKYDAALKTRPDYTEAKENKDQVEKLLEQLEEEEKKEKEQEKNDQQKQDQKQEQKKDQKNQKDQKQDQPQSGNDQKQDQQQDGNDKKDQQQQGGGQQQQEKDGGQKKDQQQSGGGQKKDEKQGQGDRQKDQQQGGQDKDQPSGEGGQDKQDQQGGQGRNQKDQQQGGDGKQDQQKASGGDEEREQPNGGDQKKEQPQQGEGSDQQGGQDGKEPGQQKSPQAGGDEPPQGQKGPRGEQGGDQGPDGEGNQPPGSSSRPLDGSGDKPAPVPQSSGEKKQGELRAADAAGQQGQEQKEGAEAVAAEETEEEGKMSATQARALLRSLQGEEEQVNLLERRSFQDVSRDW